MVGRHFANSAIIWILFSAIGMSACAPSLKATVYKEDLPSRPVGCELEIFGEYDTIRRKTEVLAIISVGETGFSIGCGADVMMELIRDNACKAGADAVRVYDIQEPDFLGTCWRAQAILIAYLADASTSPTAAAEVPD